jgi:hypothetical protein
LLSPSVTCDSLFRGNFIGTALTLYEACAAIFGLSTELPLFTALFRNCRTKRGSSAMRLPDAFV